MATRVKILLEFNDSDGSEITEALEVLRGFGQAVVIEAEEIPAMTDYDKFRKLQTVDTIPVRLRL